VSRIVVFGATSAIATEIARVYARRGDRLVLVARSEARLHALREELGDAVVGSIVADLDETDRSAALVDRVIAKLGGVDIAVIAQGALGDQEESERDFRAAEAVLRTNLLGPIALVVPLAGAMQAQGSGHLVVLSSVAGERGRPRNYTYGAAKGALTIYLQGVRSRLWKSGVSVHTVKLGPVDTPMTATHAKNLLFARAPAVAKMIVARVDRARHPGGGPTYVPWFWAPIMAVVRALPERAFQRLRFLSGR
jgi:decaprenylphospho-beta-D-erythro-pentofuranosid-2-ulose 2-reductase